MRKLFLAFLLVVTLTAPRATGAVVDEGASPDAFLTTLVDDLDQHGMDVRNGPDADGPGTDARPQVTRLGNLQGSDPTSVSNTGDRFDAFFQAGAFTEAALIAVRTDEPVIDLGAFQMRGIWEQAAPNNRVFISYSGRDAAYADALRGVLEARGFVVFTYLPPDSSTPLTNSVEVGQYFKEAGHHLLIDTANARASGAIALEAAAWRVVTGLEAPPSGGGVPPDPPRAAEPKPLPPPTPDSNGTKDDGTMNSEGEPCCKLCEYRDGVEVGCGPVECGIQCRSAK